MIMFENKDPYIKPGVNVKYWTDKEKPNLNQWYRVRFADERFWCIRKDYYDSDREITLYKIVEYYSGDILHCGCALWQARQIIRDNTYRMIY